MPRGRAGNVEDYCAKTNPSYPIEVWWGNPPAWYCTDDLANQSIPFSAAAARASAGLGAPDTSTFGHALYVICGTTKPPLTPTYTVSGVVSFEGCQLGTACTLERPPVIVSVWGSQRVAETKVNGSGAYSLTLKADPKAYTGWGTKPPGIVDLHLNKNVSGIDFVVFQFCPPTPRSTASASTAASEFLAAGGCGLSVKIKTFGSGRSGLGSDTSQSPAVPEFLGADTTGRFEGKCVSGCMNVQVSVTDQKTGKPVEGVQLTASVTPFTPHGIAPYPKGYDVLPYDPSFFDLIQFDGKGPPAAK
jgi:hypothetical protein